MPRPRRIPALQNSPHVEATFVSEIRLSSFRMRKPQCSISRYSRVPSWPGIQYDSHGNSIQIPGMSHGHILRAVCQPTARLYTFCVRTPQCSIYTLSEHHLDRISHKPNEPISMLARTQRKQRATIFLFCYLVVQAWSKNRQNSWDTPFPIPCDDIAVQYIHILECRDGQASGKLEIPTSMLAVCIHIPPDHQERRSSTLASFCGVSFLHDPMVERVYHSVRYFGGSRSYDSHFR
jgi:hypothetical protein